MNKPSTSNKDKFNTPNLEDTNLVGDIHSLILTRKTHKRLLEAEG